MGLPARWGWGVRAVHGPRRLPAPCRGSGASREPGEPAAKPLPCDAREDAPASVALQPFNSSS